VLVQVALLVFALCGMLSLVIDIGYARLSQSQMQTAADSAALEGMRNRDAIRNGAGQPVAFASDCVRRAAANRIVRRTFDDDFDTESGDPDYQFGAGPVVDVTEGVTSVHALQTMTIPEQHVYKPNLQMNQPNQVYGDMVSGRFCYVTDPHPSEGHEYEVQDLVCDQPQSASGDYARNDFNPDAASPTGPAALSECPAPDDTPPNPWPGGGTGTLSNDNAFLVRLRRSNEFRDLPGQQEESIGSSGPSLPLTFGKAAGIHGDDPTSDYSVQRDGLTVRATAIAAVSPAMHVGIAQANPAQPGVTRFSLLDTCLGGANTAITTGSGAAVTLMVSINPVNGTITRAAGGTGVPAGCAVGSIVGRFVAAPTAISTVGVPLPASVLTTCVSATSVTGQFGPVYSLMTGGALRIIGFARVNYARNACPINPMTPFTATITRAASQVATSNASASLTRSLPLPIGSTPAIVRELLDKNRARGVGRVNYGPVLVAALAR
jgi:hypothetical protein